MSAPTIIKNYYEYSTYVEFFQQNSRLAKIAKVTTLVVSLLAAAATAFPLAFPLAFPGSVLLLSAKVSLGLTALSIGGGVVVLCALVAWAIFSFRQREMFNTIITLHQGKKSTDYSLHYKNLLKMKSEQLEPLVVEAIKRKDLTAVQIALTGLLGIRQLEVDSKGVSKSSLALKDLMRNDEASVIECVNGYSGPEGQRRSQGILRTQILRELLAAGYKTTELDLYQAMEEALFSLNQESLSFLRAHAGHFCPGVSFDLSRLRTLADALYRHSLGEEVKWVFNDLSHNDLERILKTDFKPDWEHAPGMIKCLLVENAKTRIGEINKSFCGLNS